MRPKTRQLIWLGVAAVAVAVGGLLQGPLDARRSEYELTAPGNVVAEQHPELYLLTIAPGGLRAPLVNFVWIRSEKLKQAGVNYDAWSRARLICHLQSRFPGVWSFHAWNMAWNISVTTHTPEERWMWVSRGIELLRDEGIPINPEALVLYKDLAWIFFFKMGETTDEMHFTYKKRWAARMQRLLGSPAYGSTEETIDAFRPVAEAARDYLDHDPHRRGRRDVQSDQLERYLADHPRAAELADALAELDVPIGRELLTAYNDFSTDDNAAMSRAAPSAPETPRDQAISALINDASYAEALDGLLAFVRVQLLWNRYKMDPEWMVALMERYGPLDWRLPQPHGLYWVTYGLHRCKGLTMDGVYAYIVEPPAEGEEGKREPGLLNTNRVVLNNLKELTWGGRMAYIENPRDGDEPMLNRMSDWRFIEPTQREYLRMIKTVMLERGTEAFDDNILKAGHVNYLVAAIQLLYASNRRQAAQAYFDWLKDNYEFDDAYWDLPLDRFVVARINREGTPIPDLARNQITASLETSFVAMAAGDEAAARDSLSYARRVYTVYQENSADRNRFPPLEFMAANVAAELLAQPKIRGYRIDLLDRSRLYKRLLAGWGRLCVVVYDLIEPRLRSLSAREGLDADKLFPPPPGLEEYREQRRRTFERPPAEAS